MTNNDVLRKVRFIYDFDDAEMIAIFGSGGLVTNRQEISDWLKPDGDVNLVNLPDKKLAIFLNGFIELKRGKKEGPPLLPEKELNNNIIMRKLKIALDLKTENMIEIYKIAGVSVSEHEITAFFRKPDQKQYRKCLDQFLRNFLLGLQIKERGIGDPKMDFSQFR
ncbi:MAG: DUF1456 family protein [Saprospiraceae bacterium]|nr:DUF1456 family protein [Saprospiraceae bacterium]